MSIDKEVFAKKNFPNDSNCSTWNHLKKKSSQELDIAEASITRRLKGI